MAAVWCRNCAFPRFFDVRTGQPASVLAGTAPLVDVAFTSLVDGVASFAPGGLATTSDGGVTFQAVAPAQLEKARKALARRSTDLSRALPSTVRWIAQTETDPLEIAVRHGKWMRPGVALAAAGGLVAEVDLNTGGILALATYEGAIDSRPCETAHVEDTFFIACPLAAEFEERAHAASGIFVANVGARLAPRLLTTSPSDRLEGLLVTSSANSAASTQGRAGFSILRGDGSLRSEPFPKGFFRLMRWLPLNDGGLAVVNGPSIEVWQHGHLIELARPEVGSAPSKRFGDDEPESDDAKKGSLDGDLDQAPSGELRYLVERNGLHVVHQSLDGRAAITAIDGARSAALGGMHGIAIGEKDSAQQSRDGGRTWTTIDVPPKIELADLRANDIGVATRKWMRLGWGPAQPIPVLESLQEGRSPSDVPKSRQRLSLLVCTGPALERETAKAANAEASHRSRDAHTDRTRLEIEGADDASQARRWTFQFRSAPGGAFRGVSMPAPEGSVKHDALMADVVAGDEAMFWVRSVQAGKPGWVVRVSGSSTRVARLTDADAKLAQTVALRPRRGEAAIWIEGDDESSKLWAWDDAAPRVVSELSPRDPTGHLGHRLVRQGQGRVLFLASDRASDTTKMLSMVIPKSGAPIQAIPFVGWTSPELDALSSTPTCKPGVAGQALDGSSAGFYLNVPHRYSEWLPGTSHLVLGAEGTCVTSIDSALDEGSIHVDLETGRALLTYDGGASVPATCKRIDDVKFDTAVKPAQSTRHKKKHH